MDAGADGRWRIFMSKDKGRELQGSMCGWSKMDGNNCGGFVKCKDGCLLTDAKVKIHVLSLH